MRQLDYRCPKCSALMFRADGAVPVRIEVMCKRCKQVVEPQSLDTSWHVTFECTNCHRRQHCERPKHERSYCIVCGTHSLKIVAQKPSEAPSPVAVGRLTDN